MTTTGTAAGDVIDEQVVLLDWLGQAIGTRAKADVHGATTPLHLAFSLHLFGPDGRVLITRRSLSKATWPGVWTSSVSAATQALARR